MCKIGSENVCARSASATANVIITYATIRSHLQGQREATIRCRLAAIRAVAQILRCPEVTTVVIATTRVAPRRARQVSAIVSEPFSIFFYYYYYYYYYYCYYWSTFLTFFRFQ